MLDVTLGADERCLEGSRSGYVAGRSATAWLRLVIERLAEREVQPPAPKPANAHRLLQMSLIPVAAKRIARGLPLLTDRLRRGEALCARPDRSTVMTTVRIALIEPWPGQRMGGRGFRISSFLVVLADDSGGRALPVWLNGRRGTACSGATVITPTPSPPR